MTTKTKISKHYFWIPVLVAVLVIPLVGQSYFQVYQKQLEIQKENVTLSTKIVENNDTIKTIQSKIDQLNSEDQRIKNTELKKEIDNLKKSFKSTVGVYEEILSLQDHGSKVTSMQTKLSTVLTFLSKDDLKSAQKSLDELTTEINKEKSRLASLSIAPISANVPAINQAPSSGYRQQKVTVGDQSFLVDIISADLNSTKVIVDTASDSTCTDNCPVMSLAAYAGRSGAYAGINGTYFCPETYPSCAGKKNTFDVLVMNKNKVYFNSDNNLYSTVPVAIFSGNSARFIGQSSGWGRDTGVDAVIANRPLLVQDGNISFGGGGEEKEVIRSNRSFLGSTGNTGYIGVVRNASVVESAKVLQAMGVKNAINLDSGGSTALWSGGYKVGPGRNLPNVVLFVRK